MNFLQKSGWLRLLNSLILLALIPLGFATAFLFLFTGKPVPRSTEPLGPFEGSSSPRISACGRIAIVPAAIKEERVDFDEPIDIWQLWPSRKIATVRCQVFGYGGFAASLNLEKGILAITGGAYETLRWPECKRLFRGRYLGGINPNLLAISRDGTRIMICSEDYAVRVLDAETGKPLNQVLNVFDREQGSGRPIVACYFDAQDQPKGIVYEGSALTVWDIAMNRCSHSAGPSEAALIPHCRPPFTRHYACWWIPCLNQWSPGQPDGTSDALVARGRYSSPNGDLDSALCCPIYILMGVGSPFECT